MRTILLALIVLVAFSCRKHCGDDPENAKNNVYVKLESCSPASGATICLDSVRDSRCPPQVECVWQGVAVGYFKFNVNGQSHSLALSTQKVQGFPSNDTLVGGYLVRFVNLSPYAGQAGPVTAEVRVTQ